ncbi:MAG: hypothetical protein ABI843_12695 [Dokdonella sp.]
MEAAELPRSDVAAIIHEFRQALPWLRGFQRNGRGARLNVYAQSCVRIEGLEGQLHSEADLISLSDMDHLARVWRHREPLERLGDLESRMVVVIGGQRFYQDDTDHEPRNKLFELLCGCYLAQIGMTIEKSLDGDLAATWHRRRILGECKRQNSEADRATMDLVVKAAKQLQERRSADELGLVFLDLTVARNPSSTVDDAESDSDATSKAKDGLYWHVNRIYEGAVSRLRSEHDAAICCLTSEVFWIGSENRWAVNERWLVVTNPRASRHARAFIDAFDVAGRSLSPSLATVRTPFEN